MKKTSLMLLLAGVLACPVALAQIPGAAGDQGPGLDYYREHDTYQHTETRTRETQKAPDAGAANADAGVTDVDAATPPRPEDTGTNNGQGNGTAP